MATATDKPLANIELQPAIASPLLAPWSVALALALLAAGALPLDLAATHISGGDVLPGDLRRVFNLVEVFAHGSGVALILLTATVLDPPNRRRLVRVAVGAYGAGLLANGVKLIVARARPDAFTGVGVGETFGPWLPFLPHRMPEGWDHAMQSFPSGHAATAFSFALGLGALYPRGKWLFLTFALIASFQRIAANAHFTSDVLFGAALGCAMYASISPGARLGLAFDRWECR
jgi:membrane-associated phospholipid phosphatase